MSQDNASTGNVLGGAFGGEMKYMFLLLLASAGALFGSFLLTATILGNTLQAAQIGLGVALFTGGGTFVVGWLGIYYIKWSYSSSKKSYKLIVRPSNYEWPTLIQDDKKSIVDYVDDKATGYRTKLFYLAKPLAYNDGKHDCGEISEYDVQYYGNWKDLSDGQPGLAEYDDMTLPNNFTEILDVEFVTINIKHGQQVPVFRLIAARKTGPYIDYSKLLPDPNTGAIVAKAPTALATLPSSDEEDPTTHSQLIEARKQSREDKAYAYRNEQKINLVSGEVDSFKGIADEMQDIEIEDLTTLVGLNHSFDKALEWMKRGQSKWHTILPFVVILAIFIGVLAFLESPAGKTWADNINSALMNPWLDVALVAGCVTICVFILYMVRRRR